MRIFSVLAAILVAIIVLAFTIEREATLAFLRGDPQTEQAAAQQQEPAPTGAAAAATPRIRIVAQHSAAQEIDSAVILRGQTQAQRQVEVRAETTSTVMSEPLPKGSFVDAGQLLCKLSPGTRGAALAEAQARLSEARAGKSEAESRVPEAQSRVAEAEARLDEAMVNQNAATKLSEGGFAAETRVKSADAAVASARAGVESARSGVQAAKSGLQSADAGIESAQAAVAAAETEIERLEIHAPFAGLLESDTAELGTLLQPGALCATVIQLDPIKLVAFVPETDVDRVHVGAIGGGRLAAGGDVQGRVTFLSRAADPTTRTFRVEIEIPNPDLRLRDGQTVEILIATDGAPAHLLPQSALTLNDEGTLGLRTLSPDSVVEFQPVKIVRDTPKGVWLTGLPETVDVIVVGQEYVTAGVTVEPTFREASQ
ncbi:efflux RND transporter periplasmic adaptor subunit [Pseudosulfitobacter koreensis]|uniref:Efflux RND transporter periplasmic adaptor subunit n=1 Tax=Pseudosulfitobacter koreensis TaxID=2968472 RepID=A0ABT1YXV1_9RHOB|nr:efflux RND transporter periplasmic adaptor subunit [Pseudosulfitobacter koreense]MCR8825720.1 efflux RND transporter periplasmic adaptor subunit [Pseudosulfitobacter koreense]